MNFTKGSQNLNSKLSKIRRLRRLRRLRKLTMKLNSSRLN
jgi:hypothetical protein